MQHSDSSQNADPSPTHSQSQATPHGRILVVDDDVDIRRLNAELLIRSGYHAETAEDGAAAWDALQSKDYHLLITDNDMPKISGVELVKKVRSARMPLSVILASGTMQPVATLAKPFSPSQLLKVVGEVLARPIASEPRTARSEGHGSEERYFYDEHP
jgi:two-component system chemotaxis response regulator CheY